MDDVFFTQESDDSYKEIHITTGFPFKTNVNICNNSVKPKFFTSGNNNGNKMAVDKFKSRNEVIEDQLDDLNDSTYTINEYIQMVLHYKSLSKVSSFSFFFQIHLITEQTVFTLVWPGSITQ